MHASTVLECVCIRSIHGEQVAFLIAYLLTCRPEVGCTFLFARDQGHGHCYQVSHVVGTPG
jgi:hypothetical protein